MWILPKQLHTSVFVPDMMALDVDLKELSEMSSQSLMWRSKPSPVKTWLQRWKKENSLPHLSGRILKPSHSEDFVERWTSSLGDFHVKFFLSQASEPETKTTNDTCSPTSSKGLDSASLQSSSLKTSKESSVLNCPVTDGETLPERPFCSMSLESWKEWVTEQRQEYSARLKSAHLTRESESSSSAWPTAKARDWKDTLGCNLDAKNPDGSHRDRRDRLVGAIAAERDGLPDQDRNSTTGSLRELSEKSWPTARTSDAEDGRIKTEETEEGFRSERAKSDQWFGAKLRDAVEHDKPVTAKLNPRWVETLMGLPIGWVKPSDDVSNRTDELRLLGNGVVSQTAEKAFEVLINRM